MKPYKFTCQLCPFGCDDKKLIKDHKRAAHKKPKKKYRYPKSNRGDRWI